MLSYIPRRQPLLDERLHQTQKKICIVIQLETLAIPADLNCDLTEHQDGILRYVAGYLVKSLMKKYPEDEQLVGLVDRRVDGINSHLSHGNETTLTKHSTIHTVLVDYLQSQHS